MPMTLYQQVQEDLQRKIEQGVYPEGAKLPSEDKLTSDYNVSRITIRRSISELVSKGLLEKRQGVGTFVLSNSTRRTLKSDLSSNFTAACRAVDMVPGSRLVERSIVPATPEAAAKLGISPDDLLLKIRRVLSADGLAIMDDITLLPYEPYRELMSVSFEDVSLFDEIERVSGRRPTHQRHPMITAVPATDDQARVLDIPVGMPLLRFVTVYCDDAMNPISLADSSYIGDRYVLEL